MTAFTKKIRWFKKKKEIFLPKLDWTHTYLNSKGNPVKCVIAINGTNDIEVLNENNFKVWLHLEDITPINYDK